MHVKLMYNHTRNNFLFCSNKCSRNYIDTQLKCKNTCLKKYGTDNQMQNKIINEKRINTCLKKYGVLNPLQNKTIRKKYEETCLKKYGTKYISKNKEIITKQKISRQQKYFNIIISKFSNIVEPLFSSINYTNTNIKYTWKCKKCRKYF